jgi:hypothetical protein
MSVVRKCVAALKALMTRRKRGKTDDASIYPLF